jgi:hypothetical protein
MHPTLLHNEKILHIYRKIQSPIKKNKAFLLDLHAFIHEITHNETFTPIIESIYTQYIQDLAALKNLEMQTLKEMDLFFKKIKKYLKINKITHTSIVTSLKRYKEIDLSNHNKHHIDSTKSPLIDKNTALNDALDLLIACELPCTVTFVENNAIVDTELNFIKLHENSANHRSHMFTLINEFVKNNKLVNQCINQLMIDYSTPKEHYSAHEIAFYQYEVLTRILITLHQEKHTTTHHLGFIQSHAQLESGRITQTTFAPTLPLYIQEMERLERIQSTRIWFHWNKLFNFYQLYENGENLIAQELSNNKFVHAIALKKDFETIMNSTLNHSDISADIDIKEYKKDASALWTFIKKYIPENEDISRMLNKTQIELCQNALKTNNFENFIFIFKSIVASIPYQIQPKDESAFHIILHLITGGNSEESTNTGRIDLVYKTATHVYIFELKFRQSAQIALAQIYKNRYFEKYLGLDKQIFLVGLSINAKGVVDHMIEELRIP